MTLNRRQFIQRLGIVAASSAIGLGLDRIWASAQTSSGDGPYGPLQPANADGIQLPPGFTSRLIAETGQPVAATGYTWHGWPDGGACFSVAGGWVYVSNSELTSGAGGASAIRFDGAGTIVGAYRILSGTNRNCAGGVTPQGTWLSCEENGPAGLVYECNPAAPSQGIARPALGKFNHEAAFVDPSTGYVYMTEDDPSGRLYRFQPTAAGDLSTGNLFAANVTNGALSWLPASANGPDRQPGTTAFNGGEGIWIDSGTMYFTTKGDVRVWKVDLAMQTISVFFDAAATPGTPLTAVDNIVVHPLSKDIFIAEDGGNMELCVVAQVSGQTVISPFLRIIGQDGSEITGPAFAPSHDRLYVSSQRGPSGSGRTYEIVGPFRTSPLQVYVPTTTTSSTTTSSTTTTTTATTATTIATTTATLAAAPQSATATATTAPTSTTSTSTIAPSTTPPQVIVVPPPVPKIAPPDTGGPITPTESETKAPAPTSSTTSTTSTTTPISGPTTSRALPVLRASSSTPLDVPVTSSAMARSGRRFRNTRLGRRRDHRLEVKEWSDSDRIEAFLQFDTSAFSGSISHAVLKLPASRSGIGSAKIQVLGIASSELSTLSWSTRPQTTAVLGTLLVRTLRSSSISVDVTDYVAGLHRTGERVVSFALSPVGRSGVVRIGPNIGTDQQTLLRLS